MTTKATTSILTRFHLRPRFVRKARLDSNVTTSANKEILMSRRILIATFDAEENLLVGARAARAHGIGIRDAYAPYPVHGLDEAMGLRPSRLTWACGAFGLAAVVFMTWFQYWTSAIDWPINIGGKPWDSLPAFAPVIFEAMVLCAGLGTVLVFFLVSRLQPWRKPNLIVDGVTDNRFALVVEHTDGERNLGEMRRLFAPSKPVAVEERVETEREAPSQNATRELDAPSWLGVGNGVLLVILVLLIAVNVFAPRNFSRPNIEIFSEMVRTPAYGALAENPILQNGTTHQMPPDKTIARNRMPLHYGATEEDALAAGRELTNPFEADDPDALRRGGQVFQTYCITCHGASGGGDGPVAMRGFPPPPPFASGKAREMPDGGLFHILTYGRGNMPAHAGLVSRDDRWKVILHVRQLQQQADAASPAVSGDSPAPGESRSGELSSGGSPLSDAAGDAP